ncbi:MAG: hypothetical protein ACUVRK_12515 [Spirochaetota bacterium]
MQMYIANIEWALVTSITIMVIASILIFIKVNLKICEPNEILVFSGRKPKLASGVIVGYRVIRGAMGCVLRSHPWEYALYYEI